MHDAAAAAIGIVTMIPLMRAAGIEPHTNTAKFMMLSLPFACSAAAWEAWWAAADVWCRLRFSRNSPE